MRPYEEHPDRTSERWQRADDEDYERQRREDRIADHTPRVSTPMVVLSWTVLHGTWHDARDAARALAELALEADEQ